MMNALTCRAAGLAALLALSPPAAAQPAGLARPDADAIVCKRQPNPASRVGGARICRTRAAWEQEAREAQRGLRDMQQRIAIGGGRG